MSAARNAENVRHLAPDAVVRGYSARHTNGWLIRMWQAYIDDSGHRQHAPVMVLAGFVATVSQWRVFSDEWQQMLDMKPGIKYFKMNEAATAKGQFLHWSEDRITERVRQAYKIIETTGIPFQASIIFAWRLSTESLQKNISKRAQSILITSRSWN
jgi:hypothetical protein